MACDSLDDIPISASWSICLSGSTAGMAADLGTAATRCRQRVVEPLCRFAGGATWSRRPSTRTMGTPACSAVGPQIGAGELQDLCLWQ